jgi:hypothetical protein
MVSPDLGETAFRNYAFSFSFHFTRLRGVAARLVNVIEGIVASGAKWTLVLTSDLTHRLVRRCVHGCILGIGVGSAAHFASSSPSSCWQKRSVAILFVICYHFRYR